MGYCKTCLPTQRFEEDKEGKYGSSPRKCEGCGMFYAVRDPWYPKYEYGVSPDEILEARQRMGDEPLPVGTVLYTASGYWRVTDTGIVPHDIKKGAAST